MKLSKIDFVSIQLPPGKGLSAARDGLNAWLLENLGVRVISIETIPGGARMSEAEGLRAWVEVPDHQITVPD